MDIPITVDGKGQGGLAGAETAQQWIRERRQHCGLVVSSNNRRAVNITSVGVQEPVDVYEGERGKARETQRTTRMNKSTMYLRRNDKNE